MNRIHNKCKTAINNGMVHLIIDLEPRSCILENICRCLVSGKEMEVSEIEVWLKFVSVILLLRLNKFTVGSSNAYDICMLFSTG